MLDPQWGWEGFNLFMVGEGLSKKPVLQHAFGGELRDVSHEMEADVVFR
jgi:hypothetical protein